MTRVTKVVTVLSLMGFSGCFRACADAADTAAGVAASAANKPQQAGLDIKGFEDVMLLFKMKHNRYPTTAEGLGVLNGEGFIQGQLKSDPWGHPYVYAQPGKVHPDKFDITSYGADGKPGGDGDAADIVNP